MRINETAGEGGGSDSEEDRTDEEGNDGWI